VRSLRRGRAPSKTVDRGRALPVVPAAGTVQSTESACLLGRSPRSAAAKRSLLARRTSRPKNRKRTRGRRRRHPARMFTRPPSAADPLIEGGWTTKQPIADECPACFQTLCCEHIECCKPICSCLDYMCCCCWCSDRVASNARRSFATALETPTLPKSSKTRFASPKSGPQVQGVRELPHVGAGRQKTLADAPLRAARPSLSVRFLSADASPDAAKTRTLLLGPRRTRRRVRALGISSSRPAAAPRPVPTETPDGNGRLRRPRHACA